MIEIPFQRYEDLVVGAPNYYEPGGTTGGAIYVYMNGPKVN